MRFGLKIQVDDDEDNNSMRNSIEASPIPNNLSRDFCVTGSGTFKKGIFSINKKWQDLQLEDLEQTIQLGQGSSGVVYLAHYKNNPSQVLALKYISAFDKEKRDQILKELGTLYKSNSPYLVGFYGAFYDDGAISIALEYMEGGSLNDIIYSPSIEIPEIILSRIFEQVLLALQYLHEERHMIHRDLKPSNILMNRHGLFKISDFGVSAEIDNTMQNRNTFVGTVTYMSPERLLGQSYGRSSDVWSLGISLIECATRKFPFFVNNSPLYGYWDLLNHIKTGEPPQLKKEYGFSSELCDFARLCLQKDPTSRPPVHVLLQHPWIKSNKDKNRNVYDEWCQTVLSHMRKKHSNSVTKEENRSKILQRLDAMEF